MKKSFFVVSFFLISSAILFMTLAARAATITDNVPNNSLEESTVDPNLPDEWTQATWGTNTPVFEYLNEGHTGARSVKVTLSNYTDGDASWVFTPQALPSGDYRINIWYKTNIIPHVAARYVNTDGTESFIGLPDPQPNGSADWQQYSGTFSVPLAAQSIGVVMFISGNGWVQTDDYQITSYQAQGFDQGLVTLTFDDGFEANVNTALPILAQHGFKMTQCVCTQYVEGIPEQETNIKGFAAAGHEICSHTVTHPYLTASTTAEVDYELSHSQEFLRTLTGQPVNNFATPFGDYNTAVNNEIKKYYTSHRTTDEGYNSKDNLDPYRLRVQNLTTSTTIEQFQTWIDKAKADKTWLILLYHVIGTENLEQYDSQQADFEAQMAYLAQSGLPVKRWDEALAQLTGTTTTTQPANTLTFSPGWNLVTLPVQPATGYTAETLAQAVGADVVASWSAANQQYISHVAGNPIDDFAIENGVGYFVHVANPFTLQLSGTSIAPGNASAVGWNIVGWTNQSATAASQLATANSGSDVIAKFDAVTQQWVSHVAGSAINDFSIKQGEAVFIHRAN